MTMKTTTKTTTFSLKLSAETLNQLAALSLPGESRTAAITRIIADLSTPVELITIDEVAPAKVEPVISDDEKLTQAILSVTGGDRDAPVQTHRLVDVARNMYGWEMSKVFETITAMRKNYLLDMLPGDPSRLTTEQKTKLYYPPTGPEAANRKFYCGVALR